LAIEIDDWAIEIDECRLQLPIAVRPRLSARSPFENRQSNPQSQSQIDNLNPQSQSKIDNLNPQSQTKIDNLNRQSAIVQIRIPQSPIRIVICSSNGLV
jgi:hypothetical protein